MKVFEASGKSCPVFNDKHLSTEWSECVEMVGSMRPSIVPSASSLTSRDSDCAIVVLMSVP